MSLGLKITVLIVIMTFKSELKEKGKRKKEEKMEDFGPVWSGVIFMIFFL